MLPGNNNSGSFGYSIMDTNSNNSIVINEEVTNKITVLQKLAGALNKSIEKKSSFPITSIFLRIVFTKCEELKKMGVDCSSVLTNLSPEAKNKLTVLQSIADPSLKQNQLQFQAWVTRAKNEGFDRAFICEFVNDSQLPVVDRVFELSSGRAPYKTYRSRRPQLDPNNNNFREDDVLTSLENLGIRRSNNQKRKTQMAIEDAENIEQNKNSDTKEKRSRI